MVAADVAPHAVPAGIYTAQLVYTIAPQADGGSLLRADAQIFTFPARSAAEYLNPADIHSVTASHSAPDPASRTITSRPETARLARLVGGEHAFPPGLVFSCPAELPPSYQLAFTPVSASRPTVMIDPGNWMGDGVFAGGVRPGGQLPGGESRLKALPQSHKCHIGNISPIVALRSPIVPPK